MAAVFLVVVAAAAYRGVVDERDRAVGAEREGRRHLAEAFAQRASGYASERRWSNAHLTAAGALAQAPNEKARGVLVAARSRWRPELLWEQRTWAGCVDLAHSSAGDLVACATVWGVALWNAGDGSLVARLESAEGWARRVAFAPDGSTLASADADGSIRVWDVHDRSVQRTLRTPSVSGLAYAPDGRSLAATGDDGVLRVFDTEAGSATQRPVGEEPLLALALSPAGKYVATGDRAGRVLIWDRAADAEAQTIQAHDGPVRAIRFAPSGRVFATAGDDRVVRVRRVDSGVVVHSLHGHEGEVSALAFSADERWLYSGGADGSVVRWSLATGRLDGRIDAHAEGVWALARSADGTMLLSSSSDKRVRAWRLEDPDRVAHLHELGQAASASALHVDGIVLAVAAGPVLRLIDLSSGRSMKMFGGGEGEGDIQAVAFSMDGRSLACSGDGRSTQVWQIQPRQVLRTLPAPRGGRTVAFSPDGERIAIVVDDGTIRYSGARSADNDRELRGPAAAAIAFSPDGGRLILAGRDGVVRARDLVSDDTRVLAKHEGVVRAVTFDPAGDRLATAGDDGIVRILSWPGGTEQRRLLSPGGAVRALAFSPNGDRLATAGEDRRLRLWHLPRGTLHASLEGHTDVVVGLAFTPDGTRLASVSRDATARVWDLRDLDAPAGPLVEETARAYGLRLEGMEAVVGSE